MEVPPKAPKREAPLSIRVPKELREEFDERWQRSGLSKQGFVLSCVFDRKLPRQVRRIALEERLLVEVHAELVAIKEEWRETNRQHAERHHDCSDLLDQLNHRLLKSSLLLMKSLRGGR